MSEQLTNLHIEVKNLERRLTNTERLVTALWTLLKEDHSDERLAKVEQMVLGFSQVNTHLGGNFNTSDGFFIVEKAGTPAPPRKKYDH